MFDFIYFRNTIRLGSGLGQALFNAPGLNAAEVNYGPGNGPSLNAAEANFGLNEAQANYGRPEPR